MLWGEIANISEEKLWEIIHSFSSHVHLCMLEGGHVKDIVHKKMKQCNKQVKKSSKL